jgi:hypothetical protein
LQVLFIYLFPFWYLCFVFCVSFQFSFIVACVIFKKKKKIQFVGYLRAIEWGWNMNFPFNSFNNFSVQHASHRCRAPAPTNYPQNFHPHGLCSYYSNPYHSSSNCPSWGQFSNFSYEQMNTNCSSPAFESNSNFNNPD